MEKASLRVYLVFYLKLVIGRVVTQLLFAVCIFFTPFFSAVYNRERLILQTI